MIERKRNFFFEFQNSHDEKNNKQLTKYVHSVHT